MLQNFSFVLKDQLAGCAQPGSWGDLSGDLRELYQLGVRSVVSLTEAPLSPAALAEQGLDFLHLPVRDFTPPTANQLRQAAKFIDRRSRDGAVAVHCRAGIGRTGSVLAAYLVWKGKSARDAISEVRRLRPGSVETAEQEHAIEEWERVVRSADGRSSGQ